MLTAPSPSFAPPPPASATPWALRLVVLALQHVLAPVVAFDPI